MTRDLHAGICGSRKGRFLPATRHHGGPVTALQRSRGAVLDSKKPLGSGLTTKETRTPGAPMLFYRACLPLPRRPLDLAARTIAARGIPSAGTGGAWTPNRRPCLCWFILYKGGPFARLKNDSLSARLLAERGSTTRTASVGFCGGAARSRAPGVINVVRSDGRGTHSGVTRTRGQWPLKKPYSRVIPPPSNRATS